MNFMNRNNLNEKLTGLTNSYLWVLNGKAFTEKLLYVEYVNNIMLNMGRLKLNYVNNLNILVLQILETCCGWCMQILFFISDNLYIKHKNSY